jgi:hypothetical protein
LVWKVELSNGIVEHSIAQEISLSVLEWNASNLFILVDFSLIIRWYNQVGD